MPLTLLTAPANIAFARNPAIVKLRADQDGAGTLFDAVGVRAEMEYVDTDRFATNDTLVISFDEPDGTTTVVTFTAKAVYDDDNEIPDASFAGTDTEYWAAVNDIVGVHPQIAPFFRVYTTASGGWKLNIQERTGETGWSLTVTNDPGLTVNDIARTADATPDNYRVLFEVFVEQTYREGDYALAAQLEGVHESGTGAVYFDISSILAAECRAARSEPLVPTWGTDQPFLADNFRRYYYRYTEEYGSPAVTQDWIYASAKMAIDGGISQALWAEADFLGGLDATDSLLMWTPDGKRLSDEQPEFVSWYNYTGATKTVYLRVVWYDITDGTAGGTTDYFTPGTDVLAGEVLTFPVWPALFGLDVEANAYKYTVQVYYTAVSPTELSQARTYYIDRDYYESERHIMYLNGFGVPDCWRCTGEFAKRLGVERQIAERPLTPGYSTLASDRYQYARTWDHELIYRTGFLTRLEAEALQEMLIAGEVYDVSADGYIPLQITSKTFQVAETRQELRSYQFSAQPRLDMRNYSRKKLTTLYSDAWLDENGEPWFDELNVAWQEP